MDETDLYIAHDHVVILGVRINRPSRIATGEWLEFWGLVRNVITGE